MKMLSMKKKKIGEWVLSNKTHRYINTILLVITIAIGAVFIDKYTHNILECQEALYKHLTKDKK